MVDVQVLDDELTTEETTNWTRDQWPSNDVHTIFKWVGTSPTTTQATPLRYTYDLDMTKDWNPLNSMWLRGGTSEWSIGSYPAGIPAGPERILNASLHPGAFTRFASGRTTIPGHPVDKYRVWVDDVDVTGIQDWTGPDGPVDLGISFPSTYARVNVAVDVWFAPKNGATKIEILWGQAFIFDPQINFNYEFSNPLAISCEQTYSEGPVTVTRDVLATVSKDTVPGQHYPVGNEVVPYGCSIPSGYTKRSQLHTSDPIPGNFPSVGLWSDTNTPEVLQRAVSDNGFPYYQPATSSSTVTLVKV